MWNLCGHSGICTFVLCVCVCEVKLIASKGGVPGAQAGNLAFLIGHSAPEDADPVSKRIEAVVSMMGEPKKFFYCGKLGAGLAAKISNNYLSGTILLATAEAMAIGVRSGMDPKLLYECIKNSTGQSWMLDHVTPIPNIVPTVPSSNNWKPGFKTQMMIKDISLGIEAGKLTGIAPTMAEAALPTYEKAAADRRCVVCHPLLCCYTILQAIARPLTLL